MGELGVEGATIHYEEAGQGDPLMLVHGSWTEHTSWMLVVPLLAESFHVVVYDRRGHGASDGGGPLDADVDDLAALIEHAGAPAHVACNSLGGIIAMRLATRRPELLRSLTLHEPPLFGLLGDDHPAVADSGRRMAAVLESLAADRREEGAEHFAELALGPGAWDALPQEQRATMIRNAHTFLEENQEEGVLFIDPGALAAVRVPVLLTGGTESPPFYEEILAALERTLADTRRASYPGARHLPHVTHPERYARTVGEFARGA